MARTSHDLESAFLAQVEARTGRDLQAWMEVLRDSGRETRSELHRFLTRTHRWDYLTAQLMVGIFLNGGQPVYPESNPRLQVSKDSTQDS